MSDLVPDLLAAIDGTERIAREASSGRLPGTPEWVVVQPECNVVRTAGGGHLPGTLVVKWTWPYEAVHIAHNDPQAVLRRCAADREIVDHYGATRTALEAAQGTVLAGACKVRLGAYENVLRALAEGYGLTTEGEQ